VIAMTEPQEPVRPANSASKADWMTYVEAREDIDDKSDAKRDELIARVDEANRLRLDGQADPDTADGDTPPAGDPDPGPVDETSAEEQHDPDERDPVQPTRAFKVVRDNGKPLRAGGHVLVEGRGWVAEETLPAESEEDEG
jgi:hypothetical protein